MIKVEICVMLFCWFVLGKPHNPMINAGAMLLCALLKPELSLTHKVDFVSHARLLYLIGECTTCDHNTMSPWSCDY